MRAFEDGAKILKKRFSLKNDVRKNATRACNNNRIVEIHGALKNAMKGGFRLWTKKVKKPKKKEDLRCG